MAAYDEPALTSHTISTLHLGTSNCNRLCRIEKPAEVTCLSQEAVLDLDKQIECRFLSTSAPICHSRMSLCSVRKQLAAVQVEVRQKSCCAKAKKDLIGLHVDSQRPNLVPKILWSDLGRHAFQMFPITSKQARLQRRHGNLTAQRSFTPVPRRSVIAQLDYIRTAPLALVRPSVICTLIA
jgi:hypothetical protein